MSPAPILPGDFEEVPPSASIFESMRAHGYTLASAIADLIDNSIAARCTTVWLRFHWSGTDSWVSILDDGSGMAETQLRDAMRLGSRSPLEARDPGDLGRFGLGLKTASLSQCRRLTVASKQMGRPRWVRRWDLDYLAHQENAGWRLLKSAYPGSEERIAPLEGHSKGTIVLWEILDRLVGKALKDDRSVRSHFLRSVEEVEAHLSMVFHRFLTGPRPRLRIIINDNPVGPWDPFLTSHPATQSTPEEVITIEDHPEPIRLRGFILPHKDRLGEKAHAEASGPGGWNAQQGFYLYRNERLIVAGSWLGLGAGRGWTQEEHYKLARLRLDVPSSMDHLWQVDVKKSSAQPPPQVRARLTGLAQTVRKEARAVFAHRGRHRQTQTKREFTRPWKPVYTSGALSYQIDRRHPVINALLSAVPGNARPHLETALTIIEETVPIQQIWLDISERPDEPSHPFQGFKISDLRQVIEMAYNALRRNRRVTHPEAVDILLSAEEFAGEEAQAIIASLEETE